MGRQAVKNVQLVVNYNPPKSNFNTFYLESTFLIHGSVGVLLLESNAPRELLRRGTKTFNHKILLSYFYSSLLTPPFFCSFFQDPPIRRNLNFKEENIGMKEYIVVFKFLKQVAPFKFDEPIFVMKKIVS
jgi:hypothetical protein